MQTGTNVPYVKEYDKLGNLLNPIKGSYMSMAPNRSKRRQVVYSKKRKPGNCLNKQVILLKNNKQKVIVHTN